MLDSDNFDVEKRVEGMVQKKMAGYGLGGGVVILLLLSGCQQQVPYSNKVIDMIQKDCTCVEGECICIQEYSDDFAYFDCKNKSVSSVIDILKQCNYGYLAGNESWERYPYLLVPKVENITIQGGDLNGTV
jgi:hypothetical protein